MFLPYPPPYYRMHISDTKLITNTMVQCFFK